MSTPEEHPDSEGRAESPPDSPEMNSTDLYDVLDKEMKAAGKVRSGSVHSVCSRVCASVNFTLLNFVGSGPGCIAKCPPQLFH